ncbi:hypothetical protein BGZ70_001469 [Mortierella alpina]|uniref:PIN domain-containing protein n=1 Tax=Mortierella alpina TaxID=64518 RepID=A0A9P6M5U4_MORAP|nr:hypothetical protein BGZ70_001469 [Mortierella alpina]
MTTAELHALLHQHHLEQQNLAHEHQNTFFRLQSEHQHDPTPQREHELLMLQQAGHHTQELFTQQQQHLLEKQEQEQLRMQERQWHQEQLVLQRIQSHLQLQQHPQTQPQSHNHNQPHNQLQQLHAQNHSQLPNQLQPSPAPFSPPPEAGNSNHYFHGHGYHDQSNSFHQHGQQTTPHSPLTLDSDSAEAMDVDDEQELQSIASTITNLRQHAAPIDIDSVSKWSSGRDSPRSTDDEPDAVVILDTNVLISHLNFLQTLIETHGTLASSRRSRSSTGNKDPHIAFVVPWIVIQELDGLKSSRAHGGGNEVDLTEKARRAIRYVQDELEKPEETRKLRGQKISECIEKQSKNDDYILDCCRYFKTVYPDGKKTRVTLFSNDRNLCVKALIHEVKTISREKTNFEVETVRNSILGIEPAQKSPASQPYHQNGMEEDFAMMDDDEDMGTDMDMGVKNTRAAPVVSNVTIVHKNSRGEYRTQVNDRELQRIKSSSSRIIEAPAGMDPKLFDLANHILRNLRRYFEFAVPDHLRAYYGSKWKEIAGFDGTRVKEEDLSWDTKRLAQPIQLLQRNWSVFSSLYGSGDRAKTARAHLDKVQAFVKGWERVETYGLGKVYKKDLTSFLEDVDAVLVGVMVEPVTRKSSSSSSPSSPTKQSPNASSQNSKFYDASSRIRLMKDWKGHCKALCD